MARQRRGHKRKAEKISEPIPPRTAEPEEMSEGYEASIAEDPVEEGP